VNDPIVGIDLGTSNTVVAYADASGTVKVLADESGYKIHPSVVSFHPNGGVVVGAPAKQRKVIDPKNTIFSVKRLIGRTYGSPEVQTAKTRMPYEIKEGSNEQPMIVTRAGEFAVPEVSAIVLDHVKNVAASKVPSVGRAVVTVPASFTEAQRSATATAGAISGLTVVRVLNEPTAAALAYGHARNLNEVIAVYDFGGGTFDITILKLADQVYEVLGTAGDTFLGGDDLDERLVDRMVEKFLTENRIDLRNNEVAMMRLRAVAEQTKIELSRRSRAVVRIDEIAYGDSGKPLDLQIEITRDEFVRQVSDIIDRTFPVVQEALDLALLDITGINDILLVGGTTKIPYVRDQVSRFFNKAPRTDVNPEEAVAMGAALQATSLERILKRKSPSRAPSPPAEDTNTETNVWAQLPTAADDPDELTLETPPSKRTTAGYSQQRPGERPVTRGESIDRIDDKPAQGAQLARMKAPGPRTDKMASIARPPQVPAASPNARTMMIDPGTERDPKPRAGEVTFPTAGTERGMPRAPAPASAKTIVADDSDFGPIETENEVVDLEPSPAATAKGFAPPALPPQTFPVMQGRAAPATPPRVAPQPPAPPQAPPPQPRGARPQAREIAPPQLPAWPPAPEASPPPAMAPTMAAMPAAPVVLDVTPRGLGIATVSGYCEQLIRRNSRVPTEIRRLFSTSRDRQSSVRIVVCQGESRKIGENIVLGDLLLENLPLRPRGETSIEVTFALDASGILQVRARDSQTGQEQRASLDLVGAMPQAEIAASRDRLQQLRR
jgi:molecular chaperone DnaK